MAFYIKPPSGSEKLQNLALFARKRLIFLRKVLNCDSSTDFRGYLECADTADESECLIEGTRKDRVTHFILRLACCQDAEMASFFVKAETELFCYRFASMNSSELVHLLKSTHRFLSCLCGHQRKLTRSGKHKSQVVCSNLLKILHSMLSEGKDWTQIVNRYQDECRSEFVLVPFEYALSLVASRSVVLEGGLARVSIADMLKVLAFSFEELVCHGLVDARNSIQGVVANDERMLDLFREIRQLYYSGSRMTGVDWTFEGVPVMVDDVDDLSHCFPPCMKHLHRMLRKKHRLRHFSRIQYTLFLKEVGLPVSEAIKFWQREYSQTSSCDGDRGGCTHDWKHDGKRYTYSIRHLYGLEGSRVNYKAHSCRSIQTQNIGHGEEGGCPFRHFDTSHLENVMSHSGITSDAAKTDIHRLADQGKAQSACQVFLMHSFTSRFERLRESSKKTEVKKCSNVNEKEVEKELNYQPCNKKPKLEVNSLSNIETHDQGESEQNGKERSKSSSKSIIWKDVQGHNECASRSDCKHCGSSSSSGISRGLHSKSHNVSASSSNPQRVQSQNNLKTAVNSTEDSSEQVRAENPTLVDSSRGDCSRSVLGSPEDQEGPKVPEKNSLEFLLVKIYHDGHIHKPIDYYRSYIRLLRNLRQLEESNE